MSDIVERLREYEFSDDLCVEAAAEIERLRADKARLVAGIKAVEELIHESRGVGGLHMNGDFAEWHSLRTGGRFENWLLDFDAALEATK